MIQASLGSIWMARLLPNIDDFTNPVHKFLDWISCSLFLSFKRLITSREYLRDGVLLM